MPGLILTQSIVPITAARQVSPSGFGLMASRGTPSVTIKAFQTPDVLNSISFETGDEGFTDGGSGTPTWTRDNTTAAPGGGTWSVKCPIVSSPSEQGIAGFYYFPSALYDRLWFKLYFRSTTVPNIEWKWWRWYCDPGAGSHAGGLWQSTTGLGLEFDLEDGGDIWTTGISSATLGDSAWHFIECDYQRNGIAPDGSTWPNFGLWLDGVQVTHADGNAQANSGNTGPAYWANNRLYAGSRAHSEKFRGFQVMGTLNAGNTNVGQCNMDLISVSSLGRIGP